MNINWQTWATSADTQTLAQELLGAKLLHNGVGGLIVETEAYLGAKDAAAHAYQNHQTKRNWPLWETPTTIYVYQMRQYCLMNFNVQAKGIPECILLRALEPTDGVDQMIARRGKATDLCNGPGKLCQALDITTALHGSLLNRDAITLIPRLKTPQQIGVSPRIGVPNKGEWTDAPLRYFVAGNPNVSGMKKRDLNLPNKGWQE